MGHSAKNFQKRIKALPSAEQRALGKAFFKKKFKALPSAEQGYSAKHFPKKNKALPSDEQGCRAEALGKAFSKKNKKIFAECRPRRHSAKQLSVAPRRHGNFSLRVLS
jgi:hypothetical protein